MQIKPNKAPGRYVSHKTHEIVRATDHIHSFINSELSKQPIYDRYLQMYNDFKNAIVAPDHIERADIALPKLSRPEPTIVGEDIEDSVLRSPELRDAFVIPGLEWSAQFVPTKFAMHNLKDVFRNGASVPLLERLHRDLVATHADLTEDLLRTFPRYIVSHDYLAFPPAGVVRASPLGADLARRTETACEVVQGQAAKLKALQEDLFVSSAGSLQAVFREQTKPAQDYLALFREYEQRRAECAAAAAELEKLSLVIDILHRTIPPFQPQFPEFLRREDELYERMNGCINAAQFQQLSALFSEAVEFYYDAPKAIDTDISFVEDANRQNEQELQHEIANPRSTSTMAAGRMPTRYSKRTSRTWSRCSRLLIITRRT